MRALLCMPVLGGGGGRGWACCSTLDPSAGDQPGLVGLLVAGGGLAGSLALSHHHRRYLPVSVPKDPRVVWGPGARDRPPPVGLFNTATYRGGLLSRLMVCMNGQLLRRIHDLLHWVSSCFPGALPPPAPPSRIPPRLAAAGHYRGICQRKPPTKRRSRFRHRGTNLV